MSERESRPDNEAAPESFAATTGIIPPSDDVVRHALRQHGCSINDQLCFVLADHCPCGRSALVYCPDCGAFIGLTADVPFAPCQHAVDLIAEARAR